MTGIAQLLEQNGVRYEAVDYLAHGTTVATNALIERKGVPTGLLTTEGFRDLLEIGRQVRPSLYDLFKEKPTPIVPGDLRIEVPERLYYDGSVRTPLDEDALQTAIDRLRKAGVQAVAICFLFSYINPDHERAAAEAVRRRFPEAYVSVSHRVVSEFREYARLSTTVLNAYLGPVMQRYIRNFQQSVRDVGVRVDPYITQSNGGIISIEDTVQNPVRTALSGPSAGVIATTYLGQLAGVRDLITFDMGGTSADISLIEDGQPKMSMDREVDGLPARVPMLDIITIGAGGGSIAWIDAGGALKVGPQSAGASPGPACYGFGGTQPTVTDANVALGRMNPRGILGGRMALDVGAAQAAITERICKPTGLSLLDAATGVLAVVNANMVRAIRVVSVERGHDPRDFTLVAFGGAGPLHAGAVARELGIPRVLVPLSPGTLCSMGLLVTDIRTDYVRTAPLPPTAEHVEQIRQLLEDMRAEGTSLLDTEHVPGEQRRFELRIDARYRRQNYELSVPILASELTHQGLQAIVERFHAAHQRAYGYATPGAEVEFVNYRLAAVGELPKAPIRRVDHRKDGQPRPTDERQVYFVEAVQPGFFATPIYARAELQPGDRLTGPAVIEQMDATTVLLPDQVAVVDPFLNLVIGVSKEVNA
jgi:N-methylhydantoinase A